MCRSLLPPSGWWFVTCTDNFSEGWAPANYLEPIDKDREEEEEGLNEVLSSGVCVCILGLCG